MNINKIKRGDAPVMLIAISLGAILLVALFLYTNSMTDNTANSMSTATNALNTMIDKL